MKYLRALPALALALAAALSGCATVPTSSGSGPGAATSIIPELAPGQKVSIRWESYNLSSAGIFGDTTRNLVAEFERLHPNIHVDAVPPQGGTNEIAQSVQRQVVAGHPPDVAQLTFADLRYAASDLGAQPIDKLVGRDEVRKLFTDGPHPYAPRTAVLGDVDGTTYAIPYVFSTPMLFINADLFRKAGLDPANPPKTWDEVAADSAAIAKVPGTSGGSYLACLDGPSGGDWCLTGIVRSAGGRLLSEDGKTLPWTDPKTVQAFAGVQKIAQAAPNALPNLSGNDAQDAFLRGNLGMLLTSAALQNAILKSSAGKWQAAAAPMPGFGATPAVPTNSGSGLFIMTKDPAKQRAAWELIKFLTSAESETTITSNIGYVPLRASLIDDPAYLKSFADAHPGFVRPNVAQLDRLEPWVSYPGPNYQQIRTLLNKATEEIVFRGADPNATLSAAQTSARALMPK
ncbi:ABC transporter substrate-binding protein [Nocardia sp. CA2R105]|uniref:ABC transporter substrate-binding protein n=1 Tax=Nocardia coffeae TaxID=2873381 RepID=UPI001CA71E60|nr:ABC transporter substrate-binding protein [Nocardia coffeae]MBY8861195.1 ABC transporter substrate-binding protein [Nocardia coffeae]